MARATEAQQQERISKVYELIVSGAHTRDIRRYVATKTDWQLSDRQVDRYIAEATQRIIELSQPHQQEELGKAIARLNKLYFCAFQIQDYKCCLSIQKELISLLGLASPTKHELSGNIINSQIDATAVAKGLLLLDGETSE